MSQQTKKNPLKNLFKALQVFASLSPTSRKVLFQKQVKGEKTATEWLQILSPLAQFDQYSDSLRKPLSTWGVWGMIICTLYLNFGYYFLYDFLLGVLPESVVYFSLIFLYQVVFYIRFLFVVFLLIYFTFRRLDIHEGISSYLMPILMILQKETKAQQIISVQLALDKKFQDKYKVDDYVTYKTSVSGRRAQNIGGWLIPIGVGWALLNGIFEYEIRSWLEANWGWSYVGYENALFTTFFIIGAISLAFIFASFILPNIQPQKFDPIRGYQKGYPKFRTKIYEFPWLSISTRLSDGTVFQNQCLEKTDVIIRTRRQRGSSGKTKTKTKSKHKSLHFCNLKVGLSAQKYTLRSSLSAKNASNIKLKQTSNEKRHTFDFRIRTKAKKPSARLSVDVIVHLIQKVYSIAE